MSAPTEQDVLTALSHIQDPDLGRDVVSLGMIENLAIGADGKVGFTFELTTPACPVRDRVHTMAEEIVSALPGVTAVEVKMMSIGFIAGESTTAMVWRGPTVSRAIEQIMQEVVWGELDYLVIDLPPGTGDASLTIGQAIPLTGVTIVATPQDVAVDIAVKA